MGRTYEALRRAEKKRQKGSDQKKRLEKFEPWLNTLGLGEAQILEQNVSQLKDSLVRLNGFNTDPESFFELIPEHDIPSGNEFKPTFLRVLLKRKELVLGCMDVIVSRKKTDAMRKLVNEIPDKRIRSAISRKLDELHVMDSFFIKEYEKIVRLRERLKDLRPPST